MNKFVLIVVFAASLAAQDLSVSPQTLSFSYTAGSLLPQPQSVHVEGDGSVAFTLSNPYSTPWLTATQSSDVTPSTITVSVNPSGLSAGAYGSVVNVMLPGSIVPIPITVLLTVFDAPKLILIPDALSFVDHPGFPDPAPQTIYLTASGKAVSFTVSSNSPWLSVSPASGNTPANVPIAIHPENLNPGDYTGSITFTSPDAPVAVLTVRLTVSAAPVFSASNVVNVASQRNGLIAPGELVRVTGSGFGGPADLVAQVNASGQLATQLGDTQVLFDGVAAPLLLVSPNAIAAFVPYEVAGRNSTSMSVLYKGTASAPAILTVAPSSPGIFAIGPNGTGQSQALNQDSSINSPSNPAQQGTILTVYLTGEGQTIPGGVNGLITRDHPPVPAQHVEMTIGGLPAQVTYAAEAGGLSAGIAVVAAIIPSGVSGPSVPIQVTVGSAKSQDGVTAAIR